MDQKINLIILALGVSIVSSFAQNNKKSDAEAALFEQCDAKFFTESECQKWVEQMKARLPMAKKKFCPFGLSQTPQIEKEQVAAVKRDFAFAKAIDKIPVTMVSPLEGRFIVGASEFSEGNVIPIHSQGKKFKAKIVSVKRGGILFENIKTGEKAKKNLAKPNPFDKGKGIGDLPGVVPNDPNLSNPIILDNN